MNQNNEKNFIFEKNPTPITQQNNSRSTRQITYLESRTKLPVQTVTSGYGLVFVEMSGNTVGFYDYNEVEYLLVSSRRFELRFDRMLTAGWRGQYAVRMLI